MFDIDPQHTPEGLDQFVQGYLAAAEAFLEDEYLDPSRRQPIHGWSPSDVARAVSDCNAFRAANADALAEFSAQFVPPTGYSADECAGYMLWLDRNEYDQGFWTRDEDPDKFGGLSKAAHAMGGCKSFRDDSGWLILV